MFRLDRIEKAWWEAGSFNEQINLFGFVDDQVFLTKSGDAGVVLEVRGVDSGCLESLAVDNLTKRLESAFRIFDDQCRVYQYLFKANGERIPYQPYGSTVVDTACKSADTQGALCPDVPADFQATPRSRSQLLRRDRME